MGFEVHQVRKLRAKLRPRHIRTRLADGIELSYLEGWHVIAEANRIFGFDGWDRETVETMCVWTRSNGPKFSCAYMTRIRITVKAGETTIVREGSGAGEAHDASPGLAHERAAKAAETDATKRALITFGNAFGLSLYGNGSAAARRQHGRDTSKPGSADKPGFAKADGPGTCSKETGFEHQRAASGIASSGQPSGKSRGQYQTTAPAGYESDSGSPADDPRPRSLPAWPSIDPFEEAVRRANGKIDNSALTLGEPKRQRDPAHLRRVAARPCLICGRNRAQAHHLKYLQPPALGRKVSDEFTVPLCSTHHRELHSSGNERDWWQAKGIDPEPVAGKLWRENQPKIPPASNKLEVRITDAKKTGSPFSGKSGT